MEPENNQVYRTVFEHAPDAMAIMDSSGNIILLNLKMVEITGYPDEGSLCGRNFTQVIAVPDHDRFMKYLHDLPSSGNGEIRQFGLLRKDGSVLPCEFLLGMVPGGTAGPGLAMVTFRDVSGRIRSEKALNAAVKMLNRFNSVTRHDIMNQLTILLGYLELSHDMVTDDTINEFLSREEGAAEAIRQQVAFTKSYQDVGINVPAWIDLPTVIRETASIIDHPGMKVEVSVDPGLRIFADPLIRKIISNFIENTVLYGKTANMITITAQEQPDGLVIAFGDNGVGIPSGDKERIFTRGFGSKRGYGLYLAREILALTDIRIAETGEEGKGARFEVTVPKGGYRVG
jgi:PAS domain S-box-containing protein